MMDPMSDPAPEPPPQSTPLAEGRWLWRRIYVFSASAGLWVLLAGLVRAGDPRVLSRVADGVVALLALVLVLYLVAPTAQQIVELLANLKLRLGAGGRP